jgi:uncharacterized protein (DUF427 family)
MTVGPQLAAEFLPEVRIEPTARRIRCFIDSTPVADSVNAVLLFEQSHLPVYYLPLADIDQSLLEPSPTTSLCPRKGTASYFHVRVGDRLVEDAAWYYPEPLDTCPDIAAYVAFYWNKVDRWMEEDDEVFKHARDPYHRVDALHSSRHVQIVVNGEIVADTVRPRLLFETGLPTRYYIPKLDVRADVLTPTDTSSICPYKGTASYWTLRVGDVELVDAVWSYARPIPECPKVENLLCFFDEKVDAVIVDGVKQARPQTPWS